tara:strand:+ start:170 stop:1084 length:915 start_codon:yes stop_codon:yes gene_type:complete
MKYFRLRTGKNSEYFERFYKDGFIGVNFDIDKDISEHLFDNWRDFNAIYVDYLVKKQPNKTRVGAGLSCGALWTLSKGIKENTIVICPNKEGNYLACKVISEYYYVSGSDPYHRRKVEWFKDPILKSDMSKTLISSLTSQNTLIDISKYSQELENLIDNNLVKIRSNDPTIEEPSEFALEKHLEDFLIKNWKNTELGKKYDIYEEDGQNGQQFPSDTGPIDILAISKDKKTLLVVELKKGRVSDNVVGQIQRYMGYVKDELAEKHQIVKGVIIGLYDDNKIKRALSVTQNIDFYRYEINFRLFK